MRHNKDGVQNWFNPFGHFNYLLVLTLSTLVSAQSFEDFKQSQFKAYEDDKSAKEREFRSFLDKEWKAYKAYQGIKVYEKPKPKTLPVSSVKVSIPVGPPIVLKPVKKEIPRKPPEVKKPEIQKPALPKIVEPKPVVVKPPKQKPLWKIVMFDTTFEFDREKSLEKGVFEPRNKTGITNFFDTLSQSDYKALVERLGLHVKSYQLNDWALYLLSAKLSQKLYTDESEQKLFQWFILNQLGYDVKVALALERVVLLSKSKKLIYSTPNYTLSKNRYYAVDYYNKKGLGSLRTYEGNYPDAIKSLDLSLSVIPAWQREDKTRALEFRYRGQKFSLHVNYNQNLIDFMSTYPQADYDSYFNAPLDHESTQSLIKALKPIVDGKAASEAINILLFFVQHAFTYQVDQAQFGREKVMFAQETLYYKKSDCEDRAVLFAYIVKNLLGYDVVGIKYSDHMATAVAVPIKGDALNIASSRYVIADPTYINASVGTSMPKYKNVKPEKYIRVKESI